MSRSAYYKLYRRFGKIIPDSEMAAESARMVAYERYANWPPFSLSSECRAKLQKLRIAIVGGGFAGMMAAWWLAKIEKGIEIVVFEARPQIGGRVYSDRGLFAKGRVTEFGAELVGANHPLWLSLAQELGVGLMTRTGEEDYEILGLEMVHVIDGKKVTPGDAKKAFEEMEAKLTVIGQDARYIDDPAAPWNVTDASKLAKLTKFDQMTVDDKLVKDLGVGRNTLVYKEIKLLIENDLVMSMDRINYLALLCLIKGGRFGDEARFEECKKKCQNCPEQCRDPYLGFWEETERFRCVDGNQAIVDRMLVALQDPRNKYKFRCLLNSRVKQIDIGSGQDRPVKLGWEGTRLSNGDRFDYVIVAAPPPVLGDIAITPALPGDVTGLQSGPASKFFSSLKDRFWITEKLAPSGISSDIGMIWEATDNQAQVGTQEIVLAVFTGGPGATRTDFKSQLEKIYKGYRLSNSGKKTHLQAWHTEKYIKTGYSCPKVGHIFGVAKKLQEPFSQRLFLAGEHTQTDFFGFMEGALRSGRRAANAIVNTVCPDAHLGSQKLA